MDLAGFIANWWREFLFASAAALLTAFGKGLYSRTKKRVLTETHEQQAVKKAVCALLHDRLRYVCLVHIKAGEISEEELRNLANMHESYIGLGGNGTVPELYGRCLKLPIKQTI